MSRIILAVVAAVVVVRTRECDEEHDNDLVIIDDAAAVWTSPDVIVVRGVCDMGWCDGRTLEFLVFFVPT